MKIIIIGAGPAGMMCAAVASENENNEIILLDANEKVGKKLYITGKGRCNVCNKTNSADVLNNVITNGKFLYASLNLFSPDDTIDFFESNGTKLKVERGNRVFPVSDKASDISKTFLKVLNKPNVKIQLNTYVKGIKKIENEFVVSTNSGNINCNAVVIATGGKSYSVTGSKGDGYRFAKTLGHTLSEIKPALVPIVLKDYKGELAGLSLKNVQVEVNCEKKNFGQFGEMLFTHRGVSGPVILTLSSLINKFDIENLELKIDLKPALTEEKLNERLIRDFKDFKTKILKNYLKELLPSSLIDFFIKKGNFDANIPVCNIDKAMRKNIIYLLKNFIFKIEKLEDIEYAIVTSGGVNVKEINPKTMESKIINNLFFVGEVLDVDALTGGYNIQIALSTGYAAGNYLKNLI